MKVRWFFLRLLPRLGIFVLSVLLLSVLTFYISRLAPGDPLVSYYGDRVEKDLDKFKAECDVILANRAAVRETVDKDRLPGEGVLLSPRNERAVTDAPGFGERRRGLDLHALLAEGMRCMTCGAKARIAYNDDCMTCFTCELRCPAVAINVHPFKEPLPRTLEIHCED